MFKLWKVEALVGKASKKQQGITLKYMNSSKKAFSNWVNSVVFSPDDQLIAAGSEDKTVKVWDRSNLSRPVFSFNAYVEVKSVCFHPNGNYLAAGLKDGSSKMWDLRNGDLVWYIPAKDEHDSCSSIDFHPSGGFLIGSSLEGNIHLYDCQKGFRVWTSMPIDRNFEQADLSTCQLLEARFSKCGYYFITAGTNGTIMVFKSNIAAL